MEASSYGQGAGLQPTDGRGSVGASSPVSPSPSSRARRSCCREQTPGILSEERSSRLEVERTYARLRVC